MRKTITRRMLAEPRGDMAVEMRNLFAHPVKMPSRRGRQFGVGPVASPVQWALMCGARITPAIERAEDVYRKKYGGEIRMCETPARRPVCRCGAYRLRWPA